MKQKELFTDDRFDFKASQKAKEQGMDISAMNREELVGLARMVAREIATQKGETNADEVGQILLTKYGIGSLGPAAGSIFKTDGWVFTGRRVLSRRKSNHARELKVWRLVRDER